MWIADRSKVREQQEMIRVQNGKITSDEMEDIKVNQDKVAKSRPSNGVKLDISQQTREMYQRQLEAERKAARNQKDGLSDLGKLIKIARRIAKGDKVSPIDEKKLMEYSTELYQISKAAAMLNKNKKQKEHDSLFEDEKNRELNEKIRELFREDKLSSESTSISTDGMTMNISVSETTFS